MRFRWLTRLTYACCALVLFALPAVAGGARQRPNDGTLSVRAAKGVVQVAARGTIIGRLTKGQVLVQHPPALSPVVKGGRLRQLTNKRVMRQGRNIRFRLTGGFYRLRVSGRGIEINAVGRGSVTMDGDERYADTGLYSLNGDDFLPVPYERETVQLTAPPPPPTPGG